MEEAVSYRTVGADERRGRVVVAVSLSNPGARPWTVAVAALFGSNGEELTPLPLWHTGPIHPGLEWGWVVVEFEATKEQAGGTYTLKLWDAEGRTVTLGKMTFPQA